MKCDEGRAFGGGKTPCSPIFLLLYSRAIRRAVWALTGSPTIALEADRYAPSLLLAFRIARAFDVPVEEVFQYEFSEPA